MVLKFCIPLLVIFFFLIIIRSVYLFSVAAAYPQHVAWINPSIVGAVTLTLLFQISTTLTEHMTSQKYPAYKLYKKSTSRLIPLPAGTPLDEVEKKSL